MNSFCGTPTATPLRSLFRRLPRCGDPSEEGGAWRELEGRPTGAADASPQTCQRWSRLEGAERGECEFLTCAP